MIPRNRIYQKAYSALKANVESFLNSSDEYSKTIFVGVSGGADSLALFCSLVKVINSKLFIKSVTNQQISVCALIVNHNIQSDAKEVAIRTKKIIDDKFLNSDLPFKVNAVILNNNSNELTHSNNLEANARSVRYTLFNEYISSVTDKKAYLLLGHTFNDQYETVVLGLMRSSGLDAIKGISKISYMFSNLIVLRPFLTIKRHETQELCDYFNISYWNDPTNLGVSHTDPLRSKVRARIIPELEKLSAGITKNLARSADLAQNDLNYLLDEVNNAYSLCVKYNSDKQKNYLDITETAKYHKALRTRVIQKFIQTNLVDCHNKSDKMTFEQKQLPQISYSKISQIDDILVNNLGHGSREVNIINNASAMRYGKEVYIIFV